MNGPLVHKNTVCPHHAKQKAQPSYGNPCNPWQCTALLVSIFISTFGAGRRLHQVCEQVLGAGYMASSIPPCCITAVRVCAVFLLLFAEYRVVFLTTWWKNYTAAGSLFTSHFPRPPSVVAPSQSWPARLTPKQAECLNTVSPATGANGDDVEINFNGTFWYRYSRPWRPMSFESCAFSFRLSDRTKREGKR